MNRAHLTSVVVTAVFTLANAAGAEVVPIEQQKGVRGRVIVAPDLARKPRPLPPERERLVRNAATVRRPMGRSVAPLVEPAPPVVVTLEGIGLKLEVLEVPRLVVEGMTIKPSSMLVPRPTVIKIENRQQRPITLVSASGETIARIEPGAEGDATLGPGEHVVSVAEMPFATASIRMLERGRVLPVGKDGEIPLQDIPGGDYTLAFFFGVERLKSVPVSVPEQGWIFVDASVSPEKVVDVAIKDSSMRVALPPSGIPPGGLP